MDEKRTKVLEWLGANLRSATGSDVRLITLVNTFNSAMQREGYESGWVSYEEFTRHVQEYGDVVWYDVAADKMWILDVAVVSL